MIEKVIDYFKGSLRIRISGFSPERFLNACMYRNIYIWNIQPVQDCYEMNISISDFRRLKPIFKKTGVRAVIIKRYGFPFFLFQHKKRKVLFGGAVCAAGFIYLMSLFIWEIDITGNRRYTDEALKTIAHKAYGQKLGARDIRRVIRNEVEDKIAELLIDKGEGAVSAVAISADNGEIKVDAL